MLGNKLPLVSGHSRFAWQMARWLSLHGHSAQIVAGRDIPSMSPRHKQLVEREGYADLWSNRIEFSSGSLQANNVEHLRTLTALFDAADVVHVFDMRALRTLNQMFNGRPPVRVVLQVASLPKLAPGDMIRAGRTAFLMLATRPDHLASAMVPRWYLRRLLAMAHRTVCTSLFLANELIGRVGAARSRTFAVPLGVEHSQAEPVPHAEHPDFIYFGWPGAHRGTMDAASAFERFRRSNPHAHCLISTVTSGRGWGEDVVLYRRLTRRFAPRGITVSDFMPDIRQRLVGAKAALLPFRSPFGYAQPPLVVLEAMAGGVPVISTDVGSVAEMVTDGVNGYLVRPGDIEAMVERMTRLWSDPDLQKRMSDAARATVAQKFRLESTFEKLLSVYEDVVRG